jgi:hypothetical protein
MELSLFLRFFQDDKTKLTQRVRLAGLPGAQRLWLEEAFGSVIRGLGPFLAVGEPGEGLPQLGAARKALATRPWASERSELHSSGLRAPSPTRTKRAASARPLPTAP